MTENPILSAVESAHALVAAHTEIFDILAWERSSPARSEDLVRVEQDLGFELPPALRTFYLTTLKASRRSSRSSTPSEGGEG